VLISIGINAQIPAGYYYLADGKKKEVLKNYLSMIVSQVKMLNYGSGAGATWQGFYFTDRNPDNSVIDMYSPVVRFFPENYGSISGMHIEHSLPKSWWGSRENNAYKDLLHLYPADGPTNSAKGNLPLGEVYAATTDNGMTKIGLNNFSYYIGRAFEPDDEFKGDFARSYLYMSVAYENFGDALHQYWNSPMINNNIYPVWQKWAIDLLLKWHRQDPVSDKERVRQEKVFQIQGNRNPFIDYPDLVEYIWGVDTNKIYHFPVETQPFMIQPNRWSKIDFGVVMQGYNSSKSFQIWGKNISGGVTLSIKNSSPVIKLSLLPIYSDVSSIPLTATQVNNSVTILVNLNAQNSGSVTDTLVISGGGLANAMNIPINAIVSPDFMALEATETTTTTASLTWMKDNDQNLLSYTVKVLKSTAKSSDLFFSGYIEGSGNNKALVLYNNTGQTIDLSKYTIKKQTNGAGIFKSDLPLSGSLANGQKYVLVYSSAAQSLTDLANLLVASYPQETPLNFNGNDAVALYHNGVMIDVVGIVDMIDNWGMDITLQRKSDVIHPTTNFSFDEWNILPTDDFTPAVSHYVSTFSDVLFNEYSTSPNQNNYITISNLSPQTQYIYAVTAIKPSGNVTSVNRMAFRTKPLETPFALDATDVDKTSFTANWEDVEGAQNYRIDVFKLANGAQINEIEGFDNMSGSTYPSGWSGNGGATYYTSVANSGQNIPSFSFTANARTLQSKTYPEAVTELKFWYKFLSGTNSGLRIQGNKGGDEWIEIDIISQQDINAHNATYNFNTSDNYKTFKFILNKPSGGGNLAIDDISAKYFLIDTTYIYKNAIVNNTNYWVSGLTICETYFYRVKSYYQTLMSDYSNEISVKTQFSPCIYYETANIEIEDLPFTWHNDILGKDTVFGVGTITGNYIFVHNSENHCISCDTIVHLNLIVGATDIKDIPENQIIIYSNKDGIYLNNIKNGDKITIYTIIGIPLYITKATSDQIFIPMPQKGIFIVLVNNRAYKIVKP